MERSSIDSDVSKMVVAPSARRMLLITAEHGPAINHVRPTGCACRRHAILRDNCLVLRSFAAASKTPRRGYSTETPAMLARDFDVSPIASQCRLRAMILSMIRSAPIVQNDYGLGQTFPQRLRGRGGGSSKRSPAHVRARQNLLRDRLRRRDRTCALDYEKCSRDAGILVLARRARRGGVDNALALCGRRER